MNRWATREPATKPKLTRLQILPTSSRTEPRSPPASKYWRAQRLTQKRPVSTPEIYRESKPDRRTILRMHSTPEQISSTPREVHETCIQPKPQRPSAGTDVP